MSTKVKGLLKGLRYISHIFEEEEQEQELQIGNPTDVKHVAHIGWDGQTQNAPSWINQFQGDGASTPTPSNGDQQNGSKSRDSKQSVQGKRVSNGSESSLDSPTRRRSGKSRSGRRQTSTKSQSVDSPKRLSSEQSRTKCPTDGESPARDSASSSTTKPGRRKKSKASSSTKTSTKSKTASQPHDDMTNSQTRGQNGSAPDS